MSRIDYGGGTGFFGFLLRFILSGVIVWILTIILAAVFLLFLKINVDILGSLIQPAKMLEHDLPLGLISLILGWILSMLIVYQTIWKNILA